jgi:hypothetical protein
MITPRPHNIAPIADAKKCRGKLCHLKSLRPETKKLAIIKKRKYVMTSLKTKGKDITTTKESDKIVGSSSSVANPLPTVMSDFKTCD